MRQWRLGRWGLWLFFVWLVSLIFSYYVLHIPFVVNVANAVRFIAIDVVAVGALLTLAGALGRLILRSLDNFSIQEQVVFQTLLGLGLISFVVLAIGLAGLLPPRWLAWVITGACLAALYRPAWAWLRALKDAVVQLLGPVADPSAQIPSRLFTRWVRIGVLVLLALTAVMASAPPIQWDSLTYHLAGPRLYIDAGRIVSFPQSHYLGFPFLTEMLYMWLMILARPQTGPMLHGGFGVLMLMMLLGTAGRIGRLAAGWLAAAILLAGETLLQSFHWAYSDLSGMVYTLGALLLVLAWRNPPEQRRDRVLIWAGVFIGLMMGTKYTAAGMAVSLGILTLWLARRDDLVKMLRAVAVLTLVALVVFSPWLIKNVILYGNPVAPFIWGTAAFDKIDQANYLRVGTGITPLTLLLVPFQGTIFGPPEEFPAEAIGPLLVGLLPLAAIGWRKRSQPERQLIFNLLLFTLPPYLIWLYGSAVSFYLAQTRLLFPLFPAIALVGAIGLESLHESIPAPDIERIIRAVVLISLALAVASAGIFLLRSDNALRVSFGLMSEDDYLTQALPAHYTAMQHVNALPADARILFLWEPRFFYCHRNCIPDSLLNQWWHDRQLEPDPRKIAQHWREQGYTHVLIFDAGMNYLASDEMIYEPLDPADVTALEIVRQKDLKLLWDGSDAYNAYSLYELKDAAP